MFITGTRDLPQASNATGSALVTTAQYIGGSLGPVTARPVAPRPGLLPTGPVAASRRSKTARLALGRLVRRLVGRRGQGKAHGGSDRFFDGESRTR
ncbi:hypothetical protein ABT168_27680, partial [Streptomyces sp. NPDC001793]|uniref:hypothetical protein n=1 Tax=Streptomyces sp. NPDC001793 TaxID=3154657 RepID=UPI00331C7477